MRPDRVLIWLLLFTFSNFAQTTPAFPDGVASGDVTPNRAIVWTRAARPGLVSLELSRSADFQDIVSRHAVEVTAATGLTAKVDVGSLVPGTRYFYRWRDGAQTSDTGTFRTAPDPLVPAKVRFVFTGDSDGTLVKGAPAVNRFEVLDAARREQPDFFIYLGDTVYADSQFRSTGPAATLEEYRALYRENRSYSALRQLLTETSVYAVWDDHEVTDDFDAASVPPLLEGYGRQAFLEMMPLRATTLPAGPGCLDAPMFRVYNWSTSVLLIVLDERSCRSASAEAACVSPFGELDLAPTLAPGLRPSLGLPSLPPAGCLEQLRDPRRTFLGTAQKEMLKSVLRDSPARFKFVISEVPIQQIFYKPYDRWEGYAAERAEILNFIRQNRIQNVVFLSADLHAGLVGGVRQDLESDPKEIATEIVSGPIATVPLLQELQQLAIYTPLNFNLAVGYVRIECAAVNQFNYGVVDVDPAAGTATVTLKDELGFTLCSRQLSVPRPNPASPRPAGR